MGDLDHVPWEIRWLERIRRSLPIWAQVLFVLALLLIGAVIGNSLIEDGQRLKDEVKQQKVDK